MKVIVTGATGMLGQAAIRACLAASDVERVVTLGRQPSGQGEDLVVKDLFDLSPVEEQLRGLDVCLFCLGVTSAGMSEADYSRITHDLALSVCGTLLRLNPGMTLVFVSGAGTDADSKTMWARVKGRTENDLMAMPWKQSYMLRPAMIRPMHGIKSRTTSYRVSYTLMWPFFPLLSLFPGIYINSDRLAAAMLHLGRHGWGKQIPDSRELNAIAATAARTSP